MSDVILHIFFQTLMKIFSIFKMLAILITIIIITSFVMVGIYQNFYLNIFSLITFRKIKHNTNKKDIEEITKLNNDDNNDNKLLILTKFNTLVNKLMPPNIYDYLTNTYSKIFGNKAAKLLIDNIPKRNYISKKNSNKKVRFKIKLEEMENDC